MTGCELVNGLSINKRLFGDCEACHLGKERKPSPLQNIDRGITNKNQVIFVDLLFPKYSKDAKAYKAVLVVVYGYSRYTTVYPLHSKNAPEVNEAMKRYITWAERQFPNHSVKQVISDGGGKFVDEEMNKWYRAQGIEFLPNPPHGSHLDLCGRAHQTLIHMMSMKSMMATARLPKSFWKDALEMAVFVRNRTNFRAISNQYTISHDNERET